MLCLRRNALHRTVLRDADELGLVALTDAARMEIETPRGDQLPLTGACRVPGWKDVPQAGHGAVNVLLSI
jgi:hypothetical protein